MEMAVLRGIEFDLGIPLSYRFLRRNARVCQAPMELLTLARYILERSLMDYEMCQVRDSRLAAAALALARRMASHAIPWDATLIHYSGYNEPELIDVVKHLNNMVSQPVSKNLATIHAKYSHSVFSSVAKTPALRPSQLQQYEEEMKSAAEAAANS